MPGGPRGAIALRCSRCAARSSVRRFAAPGSGCPRSNIRAITVRNAFGGATVKEGCGAPWAA